MRIAHRHIALPLLSLCLLSVLFVSGCRKGGEDVAGRRQFLSMGTAPVGGAFPVVGGAIAEVLNDHKGEIDWKVSAKGTKGSQQNIRGLQQGELELALSNAAITYFAVRGGGTWDKTYDMQAIATLAPNVAMFITRSDSGIKKISDLKGKRVIIGPAGAGFEMFVRPLVEAHGVAWDSFTQLNAPQSGAVDQLGDGSADAAFLGGAVPTGSITQASSTFDVFFVPLEPEVREKLIADYSFFHPATVPAGTYSGLDADYAGLNVGSMHLITSANQDEELIYAITKTIWENRVEIAGKHPAGKAINEKNVARDTGTPYHPGAIRFYKEAGIWPASAGASQSEAAAGVAAEAEAAQSEATPDQPAVEPAAASAAKE